MKNQIKRCREPRCRHTIYKRTQKQAAVTLSISISLYLCVIFFFALVFCWLSRPYCQLKVFIFLMFFSPLCVTVCKVATTGAKVGDKF